MAGITTSAKSLKSATTSVDVSAATAPTSGQVLTATSGTAATWQTPSAGGGDWTFIGTSAPTSGTSVSFTSISSTYKKFMLKVTIKDTTNAFVRLRFNNDSSGNYSWWRCEHRVGGMSANTGTTEIELGKTGGSVITGGMCSYIVDISNVASGQNPTASWTGGGAGTDNANPSTYSGLGMLASGGVINEIDVLVSAGSYAAPTQISLWGSTNG